MAKIARDFLPEDLQPCCQAQAITASIAVQACARTQETDWLLDLAGQRVDIAGVVGWADFLSDQFNDNLVKWQRYQYFCGLRAMLQDMPDPLAIIQHPVFSHNMIHLQKQGLVFDILLKSFQLHDAFLFCKKHDKHYMILDHGGKPDIKNRDREAWLSELKKLATLPHLSCKLSGLVTEADWLTGERNDIIQYAKDIIDLFGPKRVLFGSDWPVCLLASSYAGVVDLATEAMRENSPQEQAWMFGENAVAFYNLKLS